MPNFPDGPADVGTLQVAACTSHSDCYAGGSYNYALFQGDREPQILAFAHLAGSAAGTTMQRVTENDGSDWGPLACAEGALCVGFDRTKTPAG